MIEQIESLQRACDRATARAEQAEAELTDIRERYACLNANYKSMMEQRDRYQKALELIKNEPMPEKGSWATHIRMQTIARKALAGVQAERETRCLAIPREEWDALVKDRLSGRSDSQTPRPADGQGDTQLNKKD